MLLLLIFCCHELYCKLSHELHHAWRVELQHAYSARDANTGMQLCWVMIPSLHLFA